MITASKKHYKVMIKNFRPRITTISKNLLKKFFESKNPKKFHFSLFESHKHLSNQLEQNIFVSSAHPVYQCAYRSVEYFKEPTY